MASTVMLDDRRQATLDIVIPARRRIPVFIEKPSGYLPQDWLRQAAKMKRGKSKTGPSMIEDCPFRHAAAALDPVFVEHDPITFRRHAGEDAVRG